MAFRMIAITLPYCYDGEADDIVGKLASGEAWRVHIRKPEASPEQVRCLLDAVPPVWRERLTIHDHLDLAVEYGLGGVHLNRRCSTPPRLWHGLVSRSLHKVGEIDLYEYDYAFLSPVFPSISKPGYMGNLDKEILREHLNDRIFALGGVEPRRVEELRAMGFSGAAMLGAAWRAKVDLDAFRLQFITHGSTRFTMAQEAVMVTDGGCRWVQLRMKDASATEIIDAGMAVGALCRERGYTFIVDDHVELVDRLRADGVHLGKNDMPVKEARLILGPKKIIGATANTIDDVMKACREGADYIGVGPFRFTDTKKNLSPILGLEGYRSIVARCRHEGISQPIVAIGGITTGDIRELMATGVAGVAMSGEILRAHDPMEKTKAIVRILYNSNNKI